MRIQTIKSLEQLFADATKREKDADNTKYREGQPRSMHAEEELRLGFCRDCMVAHKDREDDGDDRHAGHHSKRAHGAVEP